jgi:prepilin-type N-terminal cleavage/methylation domain-containing protein
MQRVSTRASRSGFTLIELLVVIAIIAILIGLLMPAVQSAREAGYRIACANNLKQIGLACHLYHDAHKRLPPSHGATTGGSEGPAWSWMILPFLEQDNLYKLWPDGWPYPGIPPGGPITTDGINFTAEVMSTPVPIYYCPSFRTPSSPVGALPFAQDPSCLLNTSLPTAVGDYGGSIGTTGSDAPLVVNNGLPIPPNGAFQALIGVRFVEITDGLTNTLMVGEKHVPRGFEGAYPWDCSNYDGHNPACNTRAAGPSFPIAISPTDIDWKFGSHHPGICLFTFCDGSVRPLAKTINPITLGLLAQRNDGQVIPDY